MSYIIQLAMREELPEETLAHLQDVTVLTSIMQNLHDLRSRVIIAVTGVGKVASASFVSAALMAGHGRSGVVSSGYCGSLSEGLCIGDVLLPTSLLQYDYGACTSRGEWMARPGDRTLQYESEPLEKVTFHPDDKLVQKISCTCSLAGIPLVRGGLASGDRFVTNQDFSALLRRTSSADAIDMESAAVAQVCEMHCVPFAAIRIVSDVSDGKGEMQYLKAVESPSARYKAVISAIVTAFLV